MKEFIRKASNWLFVFWAVPLFAWKGWRQDVADQKYLRNMERTNRARAMTEEQHLRQAEAEIRKETLSTGILVGLVLIVGGCIIMVLDFEALLPSDIVWAVWVLGAVSFGFAVAAFFGELMVRGSTASRRATDYLTGHATCSTTSFIAASYAFCIVLASGGSVGYYAAVFSGLAVCTSYLLIRQGLRFAEEALKQNATVHAVP